MENLKALRVTAAILPGGCADHARIYSLDAATLQSGTPTVEFVRQGLGHGPATVTMPDGEILRGEYPRSGSDAVGLCLHVKIGRWQQTSSNRQVRP